MITGTKTTEMKIKIGRKIKSIFVQTQINEAHTNNSMDQYKTDCFFIILLLFLDYINWTVFSLHIRSTNILTNNPNT